MKRGSVIPSASEGSWPLTPHSLLLTPYFSLQPIAPHRLGPITCLDHRVDRPLRSESG